MNHARILSLAIVAIFLGAAGIVSAGNAHVLGIFPPQTQNPDPSLSYGTGYSITYRHVDIRTNLSIASNNPLSQWTQTSTGAYVISVPPASVFSQYIQPTLTLQAEADSNAPPFGTEAYDAGDLSLNVTESIIFTPYSQYGVASPPVYLAHETRAVILVTSGSGYGLQDPVTFGAANMETNQSNSYGAMFGTVSVTFSITVSTFQATTGDFSLSYDHTFSNAVSGELYVFPGTGTLNVPNPQAVVIGNGNYTTLSGIINYGSYSLIIQGPNDFSKTVSLGNSTKLGQSWSYKFTPTQVGNYTVTLTNSVVQLNYHHVFGVTATMPQPTVVIDSSTSSGYITQGMQVNYTATMQFNTTLPVSFIINIWDGQSNQHSVNSAYQIEVNQQVHPAYNAASGIFSYNGSFIVNSEGVSAGYITVSVSGYYFNAATGQYLRSVNPGTVTIQVVPHHQPAPPGANYLGYIEAALVLGAGGAAAYFDPDTPAARYGIMGAAAVLALVLAGVVP